jgi:Bacterial Ig-like domain (group 3)
MKGIPSLQRLKRLAAVAGVGALVVGGAVLGTSEAHAAVTQFGTGTGLTLSPASGVAATTTPTFSSTACPSGDNGSATVNALDPTTPAGTTVQNIPADQVSAPIIPASVPFTGTWNTSIGSLEGLGLNINPGTQFEVAVECFSDSQATQNGTYVQSTFVTINADGSFTANQTMSGPPQAVNLTLTANPNPATSGQTVTLTATTSVSGATGTVQFENNGTNINTTPAQVAGGVATTSFTAPTVSTATTESLTAVYTPSGSFTAGTAGALSLPVNPAPANSGTIPLAVSVPASGSFTLTVDTTDLVNLTASGLTATGTTTPITVADSRNTYPGWSVSGQDSAWTGTGTAAGGTIPGSQLGWQPTDTALAPAVTLGALVSPVTPGLGTAAPLASVHAGLGNGFGTSTLGASLSLVIPPTAPAGPYTSGLTISAVTSNP